MLQDVDYLTQRREEFYYKLVACYPPVGECKGSLEGLEMVHGAALAIQLAADCRVLSGAIASTYETPGGGMNTVRYVPGEQALADALSVEDALSGHATRLLYDKLCLGLAMPFQYCGRPGMYPHARPHLEHAVRLNMRGLEGLNIDPAKVAANMERVRSLDLETAVLCKPFSA